MKIYHQPSKTTWKFYSVNIRAVNRLRLKLINIPTGKIQNTDHHTSNECLTYPGGQQISIRLIILILSASILLNLYAELKHVIVSCWSGNTVSKAVVLFKEKILNYSNYLYEMNIFFFSWDIFSDSHNSTAE